MLLCECGAVDWIKRLQVSFKEDQRTEMSTKGEVYTVDDDSMSSQGSVNAPAHTPIPPVVPGAAQATEQSAVGPHIPVTVTTEQVGPEGGISRQEAQSAFP